MGFFNALFGTKVNPQVEQYLSEGAIIIDVRTPAEFASGHNDGAENIPLDSISARASSIKAKTKKVVLVCRSGGRAGQAQSILKAAGVDCVNAGAWQNIS